MNVLFLALGAGRKRAVVEECAQVVADGGTAAVVGDAAAWQRAGLPDGVTVIDVNTLQRHHLPFRLEHLLVYRAPRFLLHRVVARGPLRRSAKRAAGRYERRVADRLHRRLFLPLYTRLWSDVQGRLIFQQVVRPRAFDWIIVSDSLSMLSAVQLCRRFDDGGRRPGVAYSIDHVPSGRPDGVTDERSWTSGR